MKNNKVRNLAEFRRWVKIRLVEKEISQNELARQMGIPHARISEATHGKQSGNSRNGAPAPSCRDSLLHLMMTGYKVVMRWDRC